MSQETIEGATKGAQAQPDAGASTDAATSVSDPKKPPSPVRKYGMLILKISVSAAGLFWVWNKVLGRDGADEILGHLDRLSWPWFLLAIVMQLMAVGSGTMRWQLLLGGQGIRAKKTFLFPSYLIGRFWGALTPGGLGLDGWRIYDISQHTGKISRATAVTAAEKILGQLAFGLVVMFSSMWGLQFIGTQGVLLVNAMFVVIVAAGLTLLAKPGIFRIGARILPRQIQPRVQTLVDAICAYHGRGRMLAIAVCFGVGVHAFNNLIYVCAARALGVDLSVGMIFFGSSMQIMATLVPISVNGVGLRETAAVALYTAVGLTRAEAVLIPTVGFAAEMLVSATGVIFLLKRRYNYDPKITVEEADREQKVVEAIPAVPEEKWPVPVRGLSLGFGAGLLAGLLIGAGEASVILIDGGGRTGFGVLWYGAIAYGLFCGLGGAVAGLLSAWTGRLMQREAVPEAQAFAKFAGLIVGTFFLALAAFRIRRDIFHEELVWKSKEGLLVLGGCALTGGLLYLLLSFGLRWLTERRFGQVLLRSWGMPAFGALVVAGLLIVSISQGNASATASGARVEAPESAPNIIMIVIDTLRADHLPSYGYENGATPHLDRFAEDAVRYRYAYANASWTRPSFASILSGRHARSHGVMSKSDALPDAVTTLPEALQAQGYETQGFVTNFNVGPYYNFQQGFDDYRYLEPDFVLGADDSSSKLLLMQVVRKVVERVRAMGGQVLPGTAYQDAETVNREITAFFDRAPSQPFFLFAGYMDPHDPYFEHPYDGSGYARAAHPHPGEEEAMQLRQLYDGEISYWDTHFGNLIQSLQDRGLYDDTMIIITSDHGEEFHEHGGFWHGTTLYDEQIHVPLFIKWPGNARAGTTVSHWVQSIDLMPSILNRVGIDVPQGVQGGNLDEGTTRVYAEESHEGNILESIREMRGFEEFKLITANEGNPRGLEPTELYRVDDDPQELENLAESQEESVRLAEGALAEIRTAAEEGAVESQAVEVNARSGDELRQQCRLGYADMAQCCRRGFIGRDSCEEHGHPWNEE